MPIRQTCSVLLQTSWILRMAETAAHLVDSVIPHIPTRQWVLSVPAPLRYLMAYDSAALNFVLGVFTQIVFRWLSDKAKRKHAIDNGSTTHPGPITFVQRFGSALNLNVHLHCVFSDGVFVENDSGTADFYRILPPTLEEIRFIIREERTVAGFNLHVSIPIEGDDRRGLERQLRYMGRPPLSEERLTKTADGKIVVKLKSAWSDGMTSS